MNKVQWMCVSHIMKNKNFLIFNLLALYIRYIYQANIMDITI